MSTGSTARRSHRALTCCFLTSLPVCFSTACWSADDSSPVIVTASRIPESADDSFWSTTVLTREDIESRQASSLQDLLADVAGVNIDNTGGPGKASSIFLRGTESDHTLLLIDGQPVSSATFGTPPIELIPVEQIDHIEVVRGPRSTLYGSDAVGGVIQIFTRRPSQPGYSFGGSVMDGTYDTHEFTATAQARGERVWGSLSGDIYTTAGIATCLPGAATANAGCFLDTPSQNPDGYHNHSGSLTAGAQLTDQLTAEVHSLITGGWTAYTDAYQNNTRFAERVFSLQLNDSLSETAHVRLQAGRDVDVQNNYLDTTPVSRFDTTRDNISLQFDGKLASALRVISGVDYERDHIDSDANDPYEVTSRSTKAIFTELHGELAAWSGLAGARLEDNDQFGHHVTENFGLTRRLGGQERVTLTWGTAFRAPTFNELYFPGFGTPTLQPEESKSWELGTDGGSGALRWSLHLYQTTIDQLIAVDPRIYFAENIDQARIRGAELQADWHNRDWKIGGQLTGLDPINRSNDSNRGNLLPRRSKESASVELRRFIRSRSIGSGSAGVVARWEGRRYDDLANTLPMGGYLTVDVLTEWTFARDWKLQATAANLFDRDYQTAAWFRQEGRHYGITIRYQSGP